MERKVYLSTQGGGIRGINQCTLLAFIELALKEITGEDKSIADYCDGFAGCSVGSIVAVLLALGKNFNGEDKHIKASEILQLLYDEGKNVFKKNPCAFAGFARSKYTNEGLQSLLSDKFDDIYDYRPKISDIQKPIIINSAEVDTNKIILFKSENAKKHSYNDYYIEDAILASTAAPSYFPSHIMWNVAGTKRLNCTDGGITGHNNPSLLLKNEIQKWNPTKEKSLIINIGTGIKHSNEEKLNIKIKSGIFAWPFTDFFSTILNVPSDATDYTIRADNTVDYINITAELIYADSAMDNVKRSNMRALVEDGVKYVNDNFKTFMSVVESICKSKGIEMKEISKNTLINNFYQIFQY
jgi:patatin-like phospholipase/acyl hydrolase